MVPYTPVKTNMSPENQWLEDAFPTKISPFLPGRSFVFRSVSQYIGVVSPYIGKTLLKWMIWGSPYFSETSTPFPSNGGDP